MALTHVDLYEPGNALIGGSLEVKGSLVLDSPLSLTGSLQVGASGTPLTQIVVYSAALTPVAVAANTTAEQTFTVNGLTTADKVFVNKPTAQAGLGIVNVRVSAANTLAITYVNDTAGSLTPASETYQIVAIRS